MKNFFSFFLLLSFLIILSSCVHKGRGENKQYLQCQYLCLKNNRLCIKDCYTCRHCLNDNAQTARKNLKRYKKEQTLKGRVIARERNAYWDPLKCSTVSCDCKQDLFFCLKSCEKLRGPKGILY